MKLMKPTSLKSKHFKLLSAGMLSLALFGCENVAQLTKPKSSVVFNGETLQFMIEPQATPCPNNKKMACIILTNMQSKNKTAVWYNAIDGFNFVPGMRYVVAAKPFVGSPPANKAAQQFSLVKILSKRPE